VLEHLTVGQHQSGGLPKNAVFWDVTPCGSLRTDVSGERSASIIRVTRIGELETTLAVNQPKHAAKVVPSSPIVVTLMMEALRFSGTSVLK
jgi:hypothetical protein